MSVTNTNPFKLRTFFVVTGASRGLGKQTAIRLAKQFECNHISNCSALIVARNINPLKDTKTQMLAHSSSLKVLFLIFQTLILEHVGEIMVDMIYNNYVFLC